MIRCKDFIGFLDRYLDDELSSAEREIFSNHIRDCSCCGKYVEKYRNTIRLGKECCDGDCISEDVPDQLVNAIVQAMKAAPPKNA